MDAGAGGTSPATEEETIARKRSRRVSFAETTAVHVFDRDEDFETPPEERAASSPSSGERSTPAVEAEAEEGEETEGEEFLRPLFGFGRDIDSSSPGSAAGSVASNDDDNFFGPVSTSFILSGRMSDSGMSDDKNHDITLDSTAFSLHFRNVAPPDDCSANSVGSLRTPNSQSTGHLTEIAGFVSGEKLSSGWDGVTGMSLVADNPGRYDYGQLSPTLNNLVQELNKCMEPNSSKDGYGVVTHDHASIVAAAEKQQREGKSCIGDGICIDEKAISGSPEQHFSRSSPSSPSTDLIQENNAYALMEVDVHEKSQENYNIDRAAGHSDVVKHLETSAMLSPPYRSSMNKVDLQSHLLDRLLSKDQPPGTNQNATASSHLSIAVPDLAMMDAEQLHQQNHVMDLETAMHTPRTTVQPLQVLQGSISSLRSKRQQLFNSVTLSNSKLASQETHSLNSEFLKHGQRISALKDHVSKFRLPESPAAPKFSLALVERNEVQPNNILGKAEDLSSTIFVSRSSTPQQQLKETDQDLLLSSPPKQELTDAINIHDTSCNTLNFNIQPNPGCNSLLDLDGGGRKRSIEQNVYADQDHHKSPKALKGPIPSPKQLPSVYVSSPRVEEVWNKVHDEGQSVNIDWKKAVSNISDATKQVFSASISKLNIQQLDLLEDMLGKFRMARKYKRLSTCMRTRDCWSDVQNRLSEARSIHDKLLYEKAKLQLNCVKLDKLQNKAQLCQIGIQNCCYVKSNISQLRCPTAGAAQMDDTQFPAATFNTACYRQEALAMVTEKRHELNMIQQKVENLRSSLQFFCNTKGDISCDEVIRVAKEQLEMRNQCRVIHQHSWLWELNDLVKRENKRDITLNYCNLLFPRIIINISNTSGIVVNNSLSVTKIGETFPKLNAYAAFSFVFKAEDNQRVANLKSLRKKTMETSLLLGNLLDVLEEIQAAKMELMNLVSAAFDVDPQTSGQLAFHLCFMNFKSGKRFAFTIDMTNLNRSVYPSEPSELVIKVCNAQTTIAQTTLDKLMLSIRNLQPGCRVVLRLCQMISKLVHQSSG